MLRQGHIEDDIPNDQAETARLEAYGRQVPSTSTDVDGSDYWNLSRADDSSNADEEMPRSSLGFEVPSLTPFLPFEVFLGTFRDNNNPSTAYLVDLDNFPTIFSKLWWHTQRNVERGSLPHS